MSTNSGSTTKPRSDAISGNARRTRSACEVPMEAECCASGLYWIDRKTIELAGRGDANHSVQNPANMSMVQTVSHLRGKRLSISRPRERNTVACDTQTLRLVPLAVISSRSAELEGRDLST